MGCSYVYFCGWIVVWDGYADEGQSPAPIEYNCNGMGRILCSRQRAIALKAPMSSFFFWWSLDGQVSFFVMTRYPQLRKRRTLDLDTPQRRRKASIDDHLHPKPSAHIFLCPLVVASLPTTAPPDQPQFGKHWMQRHTLASNQNLRCGSSLITRPSEEWSSCSMMNSYLAS